MVGMIYGIYLCMLGLCGKFRISQPTDSVIVMVIRKHVVEWWAAGEDLSLKESRCQFLSSVSQCVNAGNMYMPMFSQLRLWCL